MKSLSSWRSTHGNPGLASYLPLEDCKIIPRFFAAPPSCSDTQSRGPSASSAFIRSHAYIPTALGWHVLRRYRNSACRSAPSRYRGLTSRPLARSYQLAIPNKYGLSTVARKRKRSNLYKHGSPSAHQLGTRETARFNRPSPIRTWRVSL